MSNSMLSVKIFENNNFIEKLVFNETPDGDGQIKYMGIIKIGRMSTAHIKLDSTSVSRMHATIEHTGSDFLFTLMARTDTFINDRKIEKEKVLLRVGDKIEIGEIVLVVYPGVDSDELEDDEATSDNYSILEEVVKPADDLFDSDDEYEDNLEPITSDELSIEDYQDESNLNKNIYFCVDEDDNTETRPTIGKGLEIKHYWHGNMVDSHLFEATDMVTIGGEEEDHFYVNPEYLPNKRSFKLASNGKDVNFFPNEVHYIEGEEEYNLDELIEAQKVSMKTNHGEIRLLYKTKIAFELEENRFEISSVPIYAAISNASPKMFLDGLNTKYTIISLAIHMIIVFLMYLSPPEIESFNLEKLNNIPERYADVILDVPEEEKKDKEKIVFDNKGKKDTQYNAKSNSDDVVFVKGQDFSKLTRKQKQIKKLVHSQGMLGAINNGSGLNTDSGTFGGVQDDDIRLDDNSSGNVVAAAGPGIRGGASGPGGGGRSLGTGGPSTGSGGRYASGRYNKGKGIGGAGRKKRSRRMRVKIKDNMISGNLTRRQIERVVKRHIDQMRYCYEKELLRNPKLKGIVTIIWKIKPNGKVATVKLGGSTLKNGAVHSCMISRIKGWKFPEPKGGGYARVKYPFSFRSN